MLVGSLPEAGSYRYFSSVEYFRVGINQISNRSFIWLLLSFYRAKVITERCNDRPNDDYIIDTNDSFFFILVTG